MKVVLAALLAFAVLLMVTGCDEGGTPDRENQVGKGAYKPIVITYNNRKLYCIERKGSTGLDTTSGAYSGLSCDWVRFHQGG